MVRNCLTYSPPKNPPPATESAKKQKDKANTNVPEKQASGGVPKGKHYVPVKKIVHVSSGSSTVTPSIPPNVLRSPLSVSLPSSPSAAPKNLFPKPFSFVSKDSCIPSFHQSPSDKPPKPSLKRCRSSPSLSPPTHQKSYSTCSKAPLPLVFPIVGTLNYLKSSPFIQPPSVSNPFLPLQLTDSLQHAGDPPLSS